MIAGFAIVLEESNALTEERAVYTVKHQRLASNKVAKYALLAVIP